MTARAAILRSDVAATPPSGVSLANPVGGVLRSPGRPLDNEVRNSMETRFGASFADVRIHNDPAAHDAASALSAQAFTYGSDVVFAHGALQPSTKAGRHLIAHELAHVIQQSADGGVTRLQRRWDRALTECVSQRADKWISRIVVDQSTPQTVTVHWSDDTTESAQCSTGKGHCCVGGAGSASPCPGAASQVDGSNCTPITARNGYLVKHRDLDHRGIAFWTEFVPARGIALHKYAPVDGTPLSHGCVRLDHDMAETIFCGVRQNRTWVQVHNEARPQCDHPQLQQEWLGDFSWGGTDLADHDGDVRTQASIRETRRMLNESFGRTLTVPEIQGLTVTDIPRCIQRSTVEEARLDPVTTGAIHGSQFLAGTTEEGVATSFESAYRTAPTSQEAERIVTRHAEQLWTTARRAVHASGSATDDRPLYWARLTMSRVIRDSRPPWAPPLSAPDLAQAQVRLLAALELGSRGQSTAIFSTTSADSEKKRILVSGFDPFGLQSELRRANPSGGAVLNLDGRTLTSQRGVRALVEGVVFPVRFADFDAGAVEAFFAPFFASSTPPDIVVTISQGRSDFELEQFAGRRRSSGSYRDNLNVAVGKGITGSIVPPGIGAGSEFIETTTGSGQRDAMVGSRTAGGFTVRVDNMVTSRSGRRQTGKDAIAQNALAGEGSGGGFLSNEIFYRVVRLAQSGSQTVPAIHLHTPALSYSNGITAAQVRAVRTRIASGVEEILTRVIDTL